MWTKYCTSGIVSCGPRFQPKAPDHFHMNLVARTGWLAVQLLLLPGRYLFSGEFDRCLHWVWFMRVCWWGWAKKTLDYLMTWCVANFAANQTHGPKRYIWALHTQNATCAVVVVRRRTGVCIKWWPWAIGDSTIQVILRPCSSPFWGIWPYGMMQNTEKMLRRFPRQRHPIWHTSNVWHPWGTHGGGRSAKAAKALRFESEWLESHSHVRAIEMNTSTYAYLTKKWLQRRFKSGSLTNLTPPVSRPGPSQTTCKCLLNPIDFIHLQPQANNLALLGFRCIARTSVCWKNQ